MPEPPGPVRVTSRTSGALRSADELVELGFAADERRRGLWQSRGRPERLQRRELCREAVDHQLVQVLRGADVLEAVRAEVQQRGLGRQLALVRAAVVDDTTTWPPWAAPAIRAAR